MDTDTLLKLPIESMDSDTLSPYQSNHHGELYCGWCLHDIRLVSRTKTGVICADCGQNLEIASQSFMHEDPSTITPDPLAPHAFALFEG